MALDPNEYSAVIKSRGGKLQPDLVNSLALKTLTREQAEAEGWTTYYVPQPCAAGHVAARYVKNDQCVSCWLVRQGRAPLYPMAKNRTYRPVTVKATADTATGAPAALAPPAPEPSKIEQRFLAELAELRDIDKAAAAVGWTTGLVQSRLASNPVFKAAFQEMTITLGIATRAPDAAGSKWSRELERAFTRRWVDVGLLEQARADLGITASDYHDHLAASESFATLVSAAEPLARLTLRDLATKEAARGNDKLLRQMEAEAPTSVANMSWQELDAELSKLLNDLDKKGVFGGKEYRHRVSGEIINLREFEHVDSSDSSNSSNLDLVSA